MNEKETINADVKYEPEDVSGKWLGAIGVFIIVAAIILPFLLWGLYGSLVNGGISYDESKNLEKFNAPPAPELKPNPVENYREFRRAENEKLNVRRISKCKKSNENIFRTNFYIIFPATLGGDPILFQHLFWFYSHPAVYIMILPGMGVVSELIPAFSRKKIYGYNAVALATIAIAFFGFLVWGHHMFVAGESYYSAMAFSLLSYLVAVPSAIKVFNWTATLYKGSISFDTPMLYAFGFIALFTIGGMTGLFLAALGLDIHVHDTYFVIAHFHYIMVGGMVMAYFGGLHYWFPKISGKLYPEGWAKLACLTVFVGFNLTFFPQFILGYLGMPRRYHNYPANLQVWNVLSTAGVSILGVGYVMPLIYLLWSWRYGKKAGANPWDATGLEWTTNSPPPKENFILTPVVTEEPYNYPTDDEEQPKLWEEEN